MELRNFIPHATKLTGSIERRENDAVIIKGSKKSSFVDLDIEEELEEEYGVGFTILKQQGFVYGMGLGRNEQGDPYVLKVNPTTVLGSEKEDTSLGKDWSCTNCQSLNNGFSLICEKCGVDRSFYSKDMDIDY